MKSNLPPVNLMDMEKEIFVKN